MAPPELELANFELSDADLDRTFSTVDMPGAKTATLREIASRLETTYCRSIGVEFMHIQDPDQKAWIQRRVEGAPWRSAATAKAKRKILQQLTEAEGFEAFCQKRFVTTKLTAAPNVAHVKSALAIRTSKKLPGVPIAVEDKRESEHPRPAIRAATGV